MFEKPQRKRETKENLDMDEVSNGLNMYNRGYCFELQVIKEKRFTKPIPLVDT